MFIFFFVWKKKIRLDSIVEVVRAELSDPNQDPVLHEIIKSTMIHCPCGVFNYSSPCMVAGVCTKRYPRTFLKETQTGEDGFPQCRRRSAEDAGITIKINGNDIVHMVVSYQWVCMSELAYDVSQLIQVVSVGVSKFNHDQKKVYDDVLNSVGSNSGSYSFSVLLVELGKHFRSLFCLLKLEVEKISL
ncbi:ATP-dependent DNA helicase [Nephila pilipes]|uniref:ATP-dependent DNA helicase n=1 Tax=Nephila pilipes TaxID=299642 RepID=A0A8X6P365_NEPPI|nr:ATP-dependent DNA helicase [Nephila pilipes]